MKKYKLLNNKLLTKYNILYNIIYIISVHNNYHPSIVIA